MVARNKDIISTNKNELDDTQKCLLIEIMNNYKFYNMTESGGNHPPKLKDIEDGKITDFKKY